MRKFGEVYKEKLNESETLHETQVVNDFKQIYNAMLEHYNLNAIHDLNEKSQLSFLTELNQYWAEEEGLNELGANFLKKRSLRLTENSTPLQKKNYLKGKATVLLSETMRQNDLKYKVYTVIDEMYEMVKGEGIKDVLSPNTISDIITEAFAESLDEFITNIRTEISESAEEDEELEEDAASHVMSPIEKEKKRKAKNLKESYKPKVFIRKKK